MIGTGLSGGDEDAVLFIGTLGTNTSGTHSLFFDGSAEGLPSNVDISGFFILE